MTDDLSVPGSAEVGDPSDLGYPSDGSVPDPRDLWHGLTARIESLREGLPGSRPQDRPWQVLELSEALVTRFEVALLHPDVFGEVGRQDLDELREISSGTAGTASDHDQDRDAQPHPALVAVQVPRAIAALYLFGVDDDPGLLEDAARGLRRVRSFPETPPDAWARAGELLCRVLAEHSSALADADAELDPLLVEALDLLPGAVTASDDEQEQASLSALAGRLRLRRRELGGWRDDPEADAAQRDRAVEELRTAVGAEAAEPLDVLLLADALAERHAERQNRPDLHEAVAVLGHGLNLPDLADRGRATLLELRGSLLMRLAAVDADPASLNAAVDDLRAARDVLPRGERLSAVVELAEALLRRGGIDNKAHPAEAGDLLDCLVEILGSPGGDDPDLAELVLPLAAVAGEDTAATQTWDQRRDQVLTGLTRHLEHGVFREAHEAVALGLVGIQTFLRAGMTMLTGGDLDHVRRDLGAGVDWMERALAHPHVPPDTQDDLHRQATVALLILATLPAGWSQTRPITAGEDLPRPDLGPVARAEEHFRQIGDPADLSWMPALLDVTRRFAAEGAVPDQDLERLAAAIPDDAHDDPRLSPLLLPLRGMALRQRALRTGKESDLEEAASTMRQAYLQQPAGFGSRAPVLLGLADNLGRLAAARRDPEMAEDGIRAVLDALPQVTGSLHVIAIDQLATQLAQARPLISALPCGAQAAAALADAVRTEPGRDRRDRLSVALEVAVELAGAHDARTAAGAHTAPAGSDPDTALAGLEASTTRDAELIGDPDRAADLMSLATAYHDRAERVGKAGGDPSADESRAFATARVALRELSHGVLLADSTEQGLAVARMAQDWLPAVVDWCLEAGDAAAAVEVTEAGRGLVLAASIAVGSVAQLLVEVGEDRLARSWQGSQTPAQLRQEALQVLGRSTRGALRQPAAMSIDEISGTLWMAGVDALAYLLPPTATSPGRALLVLPGGVVDHLPLPGLAMDDVRLRRYRSAFGALVADGPDDDGARVAAVRDALPELGDWAHESVVGPLLGRTRGWGLMRPPRLVLLPVGHLAAVPWQTARARDPDGGVRYVCADLVITYAASARQLADASRRMRLPLDRSPAVVADPLGDLPWAGLAGQAIREVFYPAGAYLGQPPEASGGRWGTVQQVRALLPGEDGDGASLLQLSTHATAGDTPGDTALVLSDGRLPVSALLDQAHTRSPQAQGGLVVCDACVTDVTLEAYDEALTLATSLLAAGAVSVIGTHWPVSDASTAVMTFMFHHFLDGGRTQPADALRAAAMWMLDPQRPIPATMPARLADQARSAGLSDPYAWAGFTHHGQ
jgi:hypothetical protein